MRFPFLAVLLGLACSSLAQYPGSQPCPAPYNKGFDSITEAEARQYLTFLATQCEGRGTGQPGFQKAADYVAARFKSFGLKPMGDDGTYFQSTTFYRSRMKPGSTVLALGDKKLAGERDLQLRAPGDLDLSAQVAVVRASGASAKIEAADQLKGKLIILDGEGVSRQFRSQIFQAEPAGVLTLRPKLGPITWDVSQQQPSTGRSSGVSGSISLVGARKLLDELSPGASERLNGAAPTDMASVQAFDPPVHVSALRESEPVKVSNVVGLIEGSDPTLKAEVVGIGGHLDHLGKRGDVVYPGADDDGSGSTAVLCIAKALSENPVKPKRSILLMTFFGEEMGLLGSRYLSEHPPVPLNDMVSELQMDMVARDSYGPQNGDPNRIDKLEENIDTIRLVGSKRISTELDQIIQEQNKYVGFRFKYDAEDVYTRSDHYNFARHGVPIAFLFDGFTPDYHQPTDTVDKIDFKKLTNAAKLYYLTAMTVANLDHRPVHDVK